MLVSASRTVTMPGYTGWAGDRLMRTFLSYFGFFLVALSLMLLGADMITSLENPGQITLRSFQTIWATIDADAANGFVAWMNRNIPGVVTSGVVAILSIPAWSVGFIGVPLGFIRRKDQE